MNSLVLSYKPINMKSFLDNLFLTYLKLDYLVQLEVERPITLMKRIKKKKCRTETSRRNSRRSKKPKAEKPLLKTELEEDEFYSQ